MSAQPDISIIIPVFNVQEYIGPCLDSVLRQKLVQIEIICIDDCSTDASIDILSQYAVKDSRIQILRHTENKGLAATRNTGMRQAAGRYVFFMDSDDLLAEDTGLQTLYDAAVEDDADIVFGRMLYWWQSTDERTLDWQKCYLTRAFRRCVLENCPEQVAHVSSCNKLFKVSFLHAHNIIFNESLHVHEDNPFSALTNCLASSISYIPVTTYLYRQRELANRSIMQSITLDVLPYYIQFDIEVLKEFTARGIPAAKRVLYYPDINWRIESFKYKFPDISFDGADTGSFVRQWQELIDLVPVDELALFSPLVRRLYAYAKAEKYHAAWNLLPLAPQSAVPRHPFATWKSVFPVFLIRLFENSPFAESKGNRT